MRILQRLRGLFGLALAWSIAWITLGFGVFLFLEGPVFDRAIRWDELPTIAMRLGIVGALCGFAFALLIAVLERRRTFGGLTFGRMAVWGALGGCVFPIALLSTTTLTMGIEEAMVFGVFGGLGALTSVGTLALARRAPALADGESEGSEGILVSSGRPSDSA